MSLRATIKSDMKIEIDNCYNIDCIDGMRLMQEQGLKADWCITDPPYGLEIGNLNYTNGADEQGIEKGYRATKRRDYSKLEKGWDNVRIGKEYFDLIFELSNAQIIFGGNYYTDILQPTKSWIVWNKRTWDNNERNDFADCEIAWCSKGVARVFNYVYNGMIQGDMKNKDYRFHPTQKPTQLWIKILNLYTKEGDIILDPFSGSQSLRIACHKMQRHYIGFELDKDYYDKGCDWYKQITSQIGIFDIMKKSNQ